MEHESPITMKLVIIGDGAVGKTSLLLTYINKGFPKKYNPTVVDNYNASLRVGDRQLQLDIWDTAGQEDFENIRQLSYPGTHVLLACYSCVNKSSLENITTLWLPETRKTLPDTPFVLVGTKADLKDKTPDKVVPDEDAARVLKKMKGYAVVQCSALLYEHKGQSHVDHAFKMAITCALVKMESGGGGCCTLV